MDGGHRAAKLVSFKMLIWVVKNVLSIKEKCILTNNSPLVLITSGNIAVGLVRVS